MYFFIPNLPFRNDIKRVAMDVGNAFVNRTANENIVVTPSRMWRCDYLYGVVGGVRKNVVDRKSMKKCFCIVRI